MADEKTDMTEAQKRVDALYKGVGEEHVAPAPSQAAENAAAAAAFGLQPQAAVVEPEAVPPVEDAEPQEPVTFDAAMLPLYTRAAEIGLTAAQMLKFKDADTLQAVIELEEERLREDEAAQAAERDANAAPVKKEDGELAWDKELDNEAVYDAGIVKQMKRQNDYLKAQVQRLENVAAGVEAAHALFHKNVSDAFDIAVNSMPELKDDLGDGFIDEMPEGTQAANRRKLFEAMKGVRDGGPLTPHNVGVKIKKAVQIAFADKLQEKTRKELEGKIVARAGSKIHKPTARAETADDLTPDEEARRALNEKLAPYGLKSESYEAEKDKIFGPPGRRR